MNIFSKEKEWKDTLLIGCGSLGASLADSLSEKGIRVRMLDRDENAFRRLSPDYSGETTVGDATDPAALRDAGIEVADVVVSTTDNDSTNMMVAQLAKEMYHIPHVLCCLNNPEHEETYHEFGVHTLCPSVLSAKEISRRLDSKVYGNEAYRS